VAQALSTHLGPTRICNRIAAIKAVIIAAGTFRLQSSRFVRIVRPMTYPLRILRAIASTHQQPRPLCARDAQQRAHILAAAADMILQAGRQEVTFGLIASALRIRTPALRRYFACMDDLMHTILSDHLDTLFIAIEDVPENSPTLLDERRQAYRGALQDEAGRLLPAHRLLLTQAANLPYDLREDIADQRTVLGEALAPGLGKFALMLLDDPELPLVEVGEYIALRASHRRAAETPPSRQERVPETAASPAPPCAPAAPPRPMVAIPRTLAGPAAMHALQHQECETHRARAGP
jgi:AcrR family transcriptional regulator